MAVRKRSYSLAERAAEYLDRAARRAERSASSVLGDLVAEAARQEARDRARKELARRSSRTHFEVGCAELRNRNLRLPFSRGAPRGCYRASI